MNNNTLYDGYGSYDCSKKFLTIKTLKEVKKNASLENLTTKKMSTAPSFYYDGYGSYDCPKNLLTIQPLEVVKKKKKTKNASLDNEENEQRTKFIL